MVTFTAEQLYQRLKFVKIGAVTCSFTLEKCAEIVPIINEINRLKEEKNAVILTHSYISPEIVYGVGDFVGDSYKLSKDALNTKADIIVFAAVRFMAETAKILNPSKQVLIPTSLSGCTLADSITAEDVIKLRKQFPGYAFVCYINTSAEVKAECDVCVTSGNVYDVVTAFPNDKIYFLPDKLMGKNLQNEMRERGVKKDIQIYHGTCYVHEEYNPEMIDYVRLEYPGTEVISHPECSPEVLAKSDFVGSTAQIMKHMKESKANEYLMLTECGMSARLQVEIPTKKFVGTCTMCRYMKSNSLQDILRVLKNPQPQDIVDLDEAVRVRALKSINAMFEYTQNNA